MHTAEHPDDDLRLSPAIGPREPDGVVALHAHLRVANPAYEPPSVVHVQHDAIFGLC